jgi:hypothetical protein
VRTQQKDKCLREQKKKECCPDHVRVKQDWLLLQVWKWNLCKKILKRKMLLRLECYYYYSKCLFTVF